MFDRDEVAEFIRDLADNGDPEDQSLVILISRAVKRGDEMLARDLAAIPARSEGGLSVLVPANCPTLARITAVCDPIETLAWRRVLVHASVRNDRPRIHSLLELANRRCAS